MWHTRRGLFTSAAASVTDGAQLLASNLSLLRRSRLPRDSRGASLLLPESGHQPHRRGGWKTQSNSLCSASHPAYLGTEYIWEGVTTQGHVSLHSRWREQAAAAAASPPLAELPLLIARPRRDFRPGTRGAHRTEACFFSCHFQYYYSLLPKCLRLLWCGSSLGQSGTGRWESQKIPAPATDFAAGLPVPPASSRIAQTTAPRPHWISSSLLALYLQINQ